jgi:2-oxoglutarate dehydrogenase E1 component
MNAREAFYGPNVGYALELYERYLADPDSVDAATRSFFEQLGPLEDGQGLVATLARPTTETPVSSRNGHVAEAPPSPGNGGSAAASPPQPVAPSSARRAPQEKVSGSEVLKVVTAARLARGIREYGHLCANIDPLGGPRPGDPMLDPATHHLTEEDLRRLPATIVWPSAGPELASCLEAIDRLREIYCGPIGYDFDHVQDFGERAWLHAVVESGTFRTPLSPDQKRRLLRRLTEVEGFEGFMHTVYQNQKRFSIEGNDMLIPMLDSIVRRASEAGTHEILMGMAHRGRLDVLAHILHKPIGLIFSGFQTAAKQDVAPPVDETDERWTGDVKYHMGWHSAVELGDGRRLDITLADNPSHLEVIDPVVEGFARAAQDDRSHGGAPIQDVKRALPITIHGDAAFPGEGVVAETLNLSALGGYETGGTIRIIVNNQVGFTTGADEGRSTLYASDVAKGFEIPIVHVNADDAEACLHCVRLAHAYREKFHKDFLIDLIGYRRWGHNEGDEPGFTQPRMYNQIAQHPTVREIYARSLLEAGIVTDEEIAAMQSEVQDRLRQARDESEGLVPVAMPSAAPAVRAPPEIHTAVPAGALHALNESLLQRPEGFTVNPRLDRIMSRRREAIDREGGIDWALAEALAFASILADGTPIRMTGQDTERGTFSQRHLVLHDPDTGARYVPLQALPQANASFAVYNSPLSELAVMGFEYGYSVHAPNALVLWEAQFGDFANMGQVIVDQFLSAARAKWRTWPALVLLLPHAYEGQGPEHSSARLERFLQLAAEDNLRIVNCTTAAQYFHVLRLQAATLESDRRPLVLLTPKSLLRHPRAGSSLAELAEGSFRPVIDTGHTEGRDAVERLVLCSGKVAVDLAVAMGQNPPPDGSSRVAVARLEQLYPFPERELRAVIQGYRNLREVVWAQEEPENMGAWSYVAPHLDALLGGAETPELPGPVQLRYVGRPYRASTAEGSTKFHEWEQEHIVGGALGRDRAEGAGAVGIEAREGQNVG